MQDHKHTISVEYILPFTSLLKSITKFAYVITFHLTVPHLTPDIKNACANSCLLTFDKRVVFSLRFPIAPTRKSLDYLSSSINAKDTYSMV
jgi:hypothetical protein